MTTTISFRTGIFKLITLALLLVSIGAFGYYSFHQRDQILTKLITKKQESLIHFSPASKQQITSFINTNPNLEGISIVRTDFRENTRVIIFHTFKSEEVNGAFKDFIGRDLKIPLFGSNEEHNQRVVNLINGKFFCTPTIDTTTASVIPVLSQYSLHACFMSIPPEEYGDFVAFMSLFFKNTPNQDEIAAIRKELTAISSDVYRRDIVRSTRSFDEEFKKMNAGTSKAPDETDAPSLR